jgi:hypothetical protein
MAVSSLYSEQYTAVLLYRSTVYRRSSAYPQARIQPLAILPAIVREAEAGVVTQCVIAASIVLARFVKALIDLGRRIPRERRKLLYSR